MLASSIPSKYNIPFANSAGVSYIRNIPEASQIGITPGAASLTDGFPPLNFLPVSSGGVPPFGQDFNGLLNHITKVQQWQNAGGIFKYDIAFSTAIGGYPAGAILLSTDNKTQWLNLADNNTTDPDGGSPTNWIANSGGRLVRTTVYINNAGTLQSSIDGGAFANASSTFTPLTVTRAVDVEVQAPGGAGGGTAATGAATVCSAAGGAAGGYARKWITSAFSGVTVTVGAGVSGVVGGAGNNGGSSSFGAIISATGGTGGPLAPVLTPANQLFGHATGGTGTGGIINSAGGYGKPAYYDVQPISGEGGHSMFGSGAEPVYGSAGSQAGRNSTNYGSGGSGAEAIYNTAVNQKGGDSASGIIIVREYA